MGDKVKQEELMESEKLGGGSGIMMEIMKRERGKYDDQEE